MSDEEKEEEEEEDNEGEGDDDGEDDEDNDDDDEAGGRPGGGSRDELWCMGHCTAAGHRNIKKNVNCHHKYREGGIFGMAMNFDEEYNINQNRILCAIKTWNSIWGCFGKHEGGGAMCHNFSFPTIFPSGSLSDTFLIK